MSQYLKFILDRSGAPVPAKVAVAACRYEWAERQIRDEFRQAFPQAIVTAPSESHEGCNLIVLPYLDGLHEEIPAWRKTYEKVTHDDSCWMMLYGLRGRTIEAMPAHNLLSYLEDCRRVSRTMHLLRRASLLGPVSRLLERKAAL